MHGLDGLFGGGLGLLAGCGEGTGRAAAAGVAVALDAAVAQDFVEHLFEEAGVLAEHVAHAQAGHQHQACGTIAQGLVRAHKVLPDFRGLGLLHEAVEGIAHGIMAALLAIDVRGTQSVGGGVVLVVAGDAFPGEAPGEIDVKQATDAVRLVKSTRIDKKAACNAEVVGAPV